MPIRLKRTATVNPPASLSFGEIAWSENGILYIGRSLGGVSAIAGVDVANFKPPQYSLSSLPLASEANGRIAVLLDGDGGVPRFVYCDGEKWRYAYNNLEVSPTKVPTTFFTAVAGVDLFPYSLISMSSGSAVLASSASGAAGEARGFVNRACTAGQIINVFATGEMQIIGAQAGTTYFLSTIGGQITNTPPAAKSNLLLQEIGIGTSSGKVLFCPKTPILRA